MNEQKDASKCDERQVKSKPNPLAHKTKGATHIMGIQGMKTWKLGAFFVVSLMLVLGVFTNTASAQSSTATNVSSVTAEDVIDLQITHWVKEDAADSNGGFTVASTGTYQVEFTLPAAVTEVGAWTAAYPQSATSGESFGTVPALVAPATSYAVPWSSLGTGQSMQTASYVTVSHSLRGADLSVTVLAITDTSVTVTLGRPSTATTDTVLKNFSWIRVTFHNVMVGKFLQADDDFTMVNAMDEHEISVTTSTTPTQTDAVAAAMITVNRRYAGEVDIKAPITNIVTADGPVDLKVRYRATEQLADNTDTDTATAGIQHTSVGVIQINLPDGVDNAGSSDASADWTTDLAVGNLEVRSGPRVVVSSGGVTYNAGNIRIEVDNMPRGSWVDLTVSNLQVPVYDPSATMQTIEIYSEQYVASATQTAVEVRTADTDLDTSDVGHTLMGGHPMVTVIPRTLGTITKVPRVVTAEDQFNLMIRYTATDELASNDRDLDEDGATTPDEAILGRIQIELPAGWMFSDTDVAASSSSSVMFEDSDSDPMTTEYLTVTGQVIDINVDHMPRGSWVELTVSDLQVPGFDETQMTATIEVHSERYYGVARAIGTLATPMAHAPRAGHPEIVVNERNRGRVTVSEDMVKADGPVDLTVRYTATDELAKPESATDAGDGTYGRIQVTLPEGWGPENDYDLLNFVTLRNHSRVMADDLTEASISGTQSIGYIIDIDVDKMARGQWVELDFDGIQAPEYDDTSTEATIGVLSDKYNSATDRSAAIVLEEPAAHAPEAGDLTITVEPRLLGSISRLPRQVTAVDVLDLRIRYTATEDLADPDPDGDDTTDDAIYGTIQVQLPEGWGPDITDEDVSVAGSSSVEFSDPSHTVDGSIIQVNVNSLKDGKYVEITVNNLRVADFPDGVTGDQTHEVIEVLSDRGDGLSMAGTILETPAAHATSKFAPSVAFTAATATTDAYGSDMHPTIIVNRKYLGDVIVSPDPVVAEATHDVKVRYTATNNLAMPDPAATATDPMASTYGRIQITLPEGWGPATDDGEIYLSRQSGNRDATYLELRTSSGVTEVPLTVDSIISTGDGYRINIDVDAMRSRQWVELTVHNLMIAPLVTERLGSFEDIATTAASEKVQVKVFSDTFTDKDERDDAPELESPLAHSPVKGKFKPVDAASATQPTVSVTRKQLGKVAIAPPKVSAGSAQKFTITYTASEMLVENSVIEVRLPNWGGVPTAYQLDDDPIPAADDEGPHVYLSGSKSRLEGSTVTVQEDGDTSIVRITLGEKGLAKNNSVVLKFEGVTVQRQIAATVLIEVFSSDSVDLGVPQYPVEKPGDDKIEVTHAADGSGKVMFEFEGVEVKAFDNDKVKSNTNASVPAGLTKDDTFDLIVTYMPEGDMVGESGTAEFQITLPGNWQAEDIRSPGSDVSRSGNTITAKLKDHFGETEESLDIFLENITVPSDHGNDRFVAKSRNAKGSLKTLNPTPEVFVGNTLADNDTMSVEIDPLAAYEGEEDVNFEITLTANGPMHDSDIQITVPDGIESLQTGEAGDPNYVRKVAPAGSGVVVRVDDANDENIFITTGKLNKGGTIIVRLNNVDIDSDVSTDNVTGFRVSTRTRGTDGDTADDHNLTDVDWELIEKADGTRSIVGGEIRTITGSGAIALKPATVEQGDQNVDFDFVFTASTAFSNKTLEIVAPTVIETPLKETAGDGQVTVSGGRYDSGVAAKDRLIVTDTTITVAGLILRKGERFAIKVNNVDLFERTGDFRWAVELDGTPLRDADNPPMVVVGTTQSDVAFEIVDETGAPISAPEYNAASMQSILFRFTAENTVIQKGGTLRFTVPSEWSPPSVTDTANRATVSILHVDDDGNDTYVSKVADKWSLSARGRNVTLTIDPAKGELAQGSSVIIRYGTPDTTKYPVEISNSMRGTGDSDEDGLSIRGYYKVSRTLPERATDLIWVDITHVKDGTGTATVTPPSVRANSIDNLIRVVYTAIGTMDGGAVRITIPQTWGNPQDDDPTKPNYVKVTVSSGATLTSEVLHDEGRFVQANLTTFGAGDNVMFTYGGGSGPNRGAVAQADLGDAVFLVESRGSSGGTFEAIVDNMDKAVSPIVEVKGAASGSGEADVEVVNNKSGSVVYDGVAERRIFAGDDMTYLKFTYKATETIEEGQLELIVPTERGWTPPQDEDTAGAGYTELVEVGNAIASNVRAIGQSVTATVEMDRGDVIEIHYGQNTTEAGGAVAPSAAGTYVFQVNFDGAAVTPAPFVIVYGGTASKLAVNAPSSVSADAGAAPGAITVEIQDDTNAAAVLGSDLMVTLSSTSSTGSFADADGTAIANNMVTISAGMTQATVYYSDTGAGTTATVIAQATGLSSGTASIAVTSDVDRVDSVAVSSATAKAGDTVTVTASGTASKTATFSVGGVVTDGTLTESPAGSGSYSGDFTVVVQSHDGMNMDVTVTIGDASDTLASAITIDTSAPTITASASPMTVANGGMVTISATVTDATSVTANVSALDTTQTTVTLAMANGAYSADVTVSDSNAAVNGAKTITVTAMDAVGNSAMADVMVTLDNKMSFTSMIPSGTVLFHVPLNDADISTVGDLVTELGTAVNLATIWNTAESRWDSDTNDTPIAPDLGIVLSMNAEASITFEGDAWGGGTSSITVHSGRNLIGVPVNDPGIAMVSDLLTAFGTGVVSSVSVLSGGSFVSIGAAGDPGDAAIMGDVAYVVTAASDKTIALLGSGWTNGTASAAPIALAGYSVDNQTAVLDVRGSVVDEITGVAKEGFRVKVKNLATKAALSSVSSVETSDGYDMTFVDVSDGYSARVGDVLEISADSPNPLIGVKPVRHIVTVDDVKNNRIQLENLIAYEIPAETELLRNYPNPFNPETWIPYHLAEDADVTLRIYSINGELVRTIDVGHQTAAKYDTRSKALYWDGRNRFGEQVASGVYFYSLSAGDFSGTRKMVILK